MKHSIIKELVRSGIWSLMSIPPIKQIANAFVKESSAVRLVKLEARIRDLLTNRDRIESGPFRGMIFPDLQARGYFGVTMMLVGSFEEELHPFFENLPLTEYSEVINIGAAEGYYAVGFAMRCPNSKVYAFEYEEYVQSKSKVLATANEVIGKIEFKGWCDATSLAQIPITKRGFVFCDCEGGEVDILDPSLAPNLLRCDILVELHDLLVPNVTPIILERFRSTHDITIIGATVRDSRRYPILDTLSLEECYYATDEGRKGYQEWAVMTLKS